MPGTAIPTGASAVRAFFTVAAAEPVYTAYGAADVGSAYRAAGIRSAWIGTAGIRHAGRRTGGGRMGNRRNRRSRLIMIMNQIQQPAETFIEGSCIQRVHTELIEFRRERFQVFQFIQRIRIFSGYLPV